METSSPPCIQADNKGRKHSPWTGERNRKKIKNTEEREELSLCYQSDDNEDYSVCEATTLCEDMMMELENMNLGSGWNGSEAPSTAQTEAYPQQDSSRPVDRSSWSNMFLKREQITDGFSLACSPRTSSYSGALTSVLLSVDDSKDACFFSRNNSQATDTRQENDNRAVKRRNARVDDQLEQDQRDAVPAAAIKPRRRAFASKLGVVGPQMSSLPPSGHSQDQEAKEEEEEEFRISSILRASGREECTLEEIDDERADQFFTSPASAIKHKSGQIQGLQCVNWDIEGGFDGDDESEGSAMEGLTLQLTEADFQTPGLPATDECCWKQSRLHHHRSTSRWLPRRFHEAGLGGPEEDYEGGSLVPPEQLTTIEEFNEAMQVAATKGDRGRADSLWREMWHSKSIPPNLQLLNAYTRALAKSLAHPDEAENIAREVCIAGSLSPNQTTYTLLTEARLRYEQIFSEI